MGSLTLTPLPNIPFIRPGDDLADMILSSVHAAGLRIEDNDIFVLGQKIVSKAEGRMVNLNTVKPGDQARNLARQTEKDPRLVELMLQESTAVLRTRPGTIIVEHKLGFVCANAGIDHSNVGSPLPAEDRKAVRRMAQHQGTAPGNLAGRLLQEIAHSEYPEANQSGGPSAAADEWVLLLPANPDSSANKIRAKLEANTGKRLGVMIIDSHGRAWRLGTVGMCIGLSGLPGIVDERGWRDLFGYTLRITMVGVADELAAAASLMMGQAAEGTPVIHVRGFPYPLREGTFQELIRPKEQDLFR